MSSHAVRLTRREMERLMRPVSGAGGFQSLIRRIQKNVENEKGEVVLTDGDVEQIRGYVDDYGGGGFQQILAILLDRSGEGVEVKAGGGSSGVPAGRRVPEFAFCPRAPRGLPGAEVNREGKTGAVDLRHNRMQRRLYERLSDEYGAENVGVEIPNGIGGRIDMVVSTGTGFNFYELKVGVSARQAIRESVGQLLEYAFWPGTERAERLVVVGERGLDANGREYLRRLTDDLRLDLDYQCVMNLDA